MSVDSGQFCMVALVLCLPHSRLISASDEAQTQRTPAPTKIESPTSYVEAIVNFQIASRCVVGREDDIRCCSCLAAAAAHALCRCGHNSFCRGCAALILAVAVSAHAEPQCPTCRTTGSDLHKARRSHAVKEHQHLQ